MDAFASPAAITTPSMRRGDLVNVGVIHAQGSLVKDMEFTLGYESLFLAYLTGCLAFFDLNPSYNKKCEVNPVVHQIHFLALVLWPVVCARLVIYFKLRNAGYS